MAWAMFGLGAAFFWLTGRLLKLSPASIGGLILTPNALAVADVSAEAKKFTVIMNAATSIITTKSPYMARTSLTTPMLNETLGKVHFGLDIDATMI